MKENQGWEREMHGLRKEAREVEILVSGHNLVDTEGNIRYMKTRVSDTEKLLDKTIKRIKELDSARNLNSLASRKADVVKLPKFYGKPKEDFVVSSLTTSQQMIKLRNFVKTCLTLPK